MGLQRSQGSIGTHFSSHLGLQQGSLANHIKGLMTRITFSAVDLQQGSQGSHSFAGHFGSGQEWQFAERSDTPPIKINIDAMYFFIIRKDSIVFV